MTNRTDESLQGELTGVRWPAAWLLCAIVCVWTSGCRRESPAPEPTPAEQPAEQSAPDAALDSAPDIAPRNDPPTDAARLPLSAKVTILSVEPMTDGESGRVTMIEGGTVFSIPEEPAAGAAPTGPPRRRAGKAKPGIDPLAGIEQELMPKWDAVQSLTSKFETNLHSMTKDYEMTTEGEGTRDCWKKDGRMLVRLQFGTAIKIEIEDENPPIRWTAQRAVKVFDGEYVYTQIETHEGTTATKQMPTAGSFMAVGGRGLIAMLRSLRKLYRLPDAEIDGQSMYVFTGYNPIAVTVEYVIDKETGLLHSVKREWTGQDRTKRLKFIEHKINPGFPEDHFTYTPAEGVVVEDRTRTAAAPPATNPQP